MLKLIVWDNYLDKYWVFYASSFKREEIFKWDKTRRGYFFSQGNEAQGASILTITCKRLIQPTLHQPIPEKVFTWYSQQIFRTVYTSLNPCRRQMSRKHFFIIVKTLLYMKGPIIFSQMCVGRQCESNNRKSMKVVCIFQDLNGNSVKK